MDLRFGEVLGVVGPNGAGKTTLLRVLAGLAFPTEGRGHVLGRPLARRRGQTVQVGLMPEKPAFVEHLSGLRNLRMLAAVRAEMTLGQVEHALSAVGLDPGDRRPVSAYSQGMRQRLSFAQAVMERPRLVLLDEPTNGLDPLGVVEMRRMVRELADSGTAVMLSSHLLGEVQAVCDRVLLVDGGQIVKELKARGPVGDRVEVRVDVSHAADLAAIDALRSVTSVREEGPLSMRVCIAGPVPVFVRELVEAGVDVEGVCRVAGTLEDAYLAALTGTR